MRRLNKLLVSLIVLYCFTRGFTLADKSDCWIFWKLNFKQNWKSDDWIVFISQVWETDANSFLTIEQQKNIITRDDLNTAVLNLKKYCCENELWWLGHSTCEWDSVFFNDNALDSQYLFDHIFDVIMRRLNWLTWDTDIYTKTNMTVDPKWQERREWITAKAEDLSWSDSQSIINWYSWTRMQSNPTLWYDIYNEIVWTISSDDKNFLRYVSWLWESEESKKVANAIKNYDKWTLYDRYNNACALSAYFYILLENQSNSDDKNEVISKLRNWSCKRIVKAQIDGENKYVQLVVQRASNLFLSNYIEWYAWYLYDRWNQLKTLWKNSTDKFLDVVRGVPNLVKQCKK